MKKPKSELFALIKARQAMYGVTNAELAVAARMSPAQLTRKFNDVKDFRIRELEGISRKLKINMDEVKAVM